MATLGGLTLGTVDNENIKKSSGIIIIPLPLSDDDQTQTFDLGGVTTTITLRGRLTSTSQVAERDALLALVTGNQSPVTYVSDVGGTYNVKLLDPDFNAAGANLTMVITYTIKLVVTA